MIVVPFPRSPAARSLSAQDEHVIMLMMIDTACKLSHDHRLVEIFASDLANRRRKPGFNVAEMKAVIERWRPMLKGVGVEDMPRRIAAGPMPPSWEIQMREWHKRRTA